MIPCRAKHICLVCCLEGGRSAVTGAGGFRKGLNRRDTPGWTEVGLRWAEMGVGVRDGNRQWESSEQRKRGQSSWGMCQVVYDILLEWRAPGHHEGVGGKDGGRIDRFTEWGP